MVYILFSQTQSKTQSYMKQAAPISRHGVPQFCSPRSPLCPASILSQPRCGMDGELERAATPGPANLLKKLLNRGATWPNRVLRLSSGRSWHVNARRSASRRMSCNWSNPQSSHSTNSASKHCLLRSSKTSEAHTVTLSKLRWPMLSLTVYFE